MLSYSYKNTVGAVARLFFSDPPLTPHAIDEGLCGGAIPDEGLYPRIIRRWPFWSAETPDGQ